MKIALSYYDYALSGRKTVHTFAESALIHKVLERLARGIDFPKAIVPDLEYRKYTLDSAIGEKTEDAVDTGKPARIRNAIFAKAGWTRNRRWKAALYCRRAG